MSTRCASCTSSPRVSYSLPRSCRGGSYRRGRRDSSTTTSDSPKRAASRIADTADDQVSDAVVQRRAEGELCFGAHDLVEMADPLQDLVQMVVRPGDDAQQHVTGPGDGVDLDDLGHRAQTGDDSLVCAL